MELQQLQRWVLWELHWQVERWVLWELQVDSGGVDPHQEGHHLDLEDVQRSKVLHRRQSRRNLHLEEYI